MYGIFTYIWLIFMVNVAKYTIHGSYGVQLHHQLQVLDWKVHKFGVPVIPGFWSIDFLKLRIQNLHIMIQNPRKRKHHTSVTILSTSQCLKFFGWMGFWYQKLFLQIFMDMEHWLPHTYSWSHPVVEPTYPKNTHWGWSTFNLHECHILSVKTTIHVG